HPGVTRRAGDQEFVDEPAPLRRIALHQRQILRREQHRAQISEHVARTDLARSEEHTSELQSLAYLVCRLLLEKKKKKNITQNKHNEDKSPLRYPIIQESCK